MVKEYILSTIDGNRIDLNKLKSFCEVSGDLLYLEDSGTILISTLNNHTILFNLKPGADYGICLEPQHLAFNKVLEIADELDLFVLDSENVIYYIPQFGVPESKVDFQRLRAIYMSHGNGLSDMRGPKNARFSAFIQKIKTLTLQGGNI